MKTRRAAEWTNGRNNRENNSRVTVWRWIALENEVNSTLINSRVLSLIEALQSMTQSNKIPVVSCNTHKHISIYRFLSFPLCFEMFSIWIKNDNEIVSRLQFPSNRIDFISFHFFLVSQIEITHLQKLKFSIGFSWVTLQWIKKSKKMDIKPGTFRTFKSYKVCIGGTWIDREKIKRTTWKCICVPNCESHTIEDTVIPKKERKYIHALVLELPATTAVQVVCKVDAFFHSSFLVSLFLTLSSFCKCSISPSNKLRNVK